MAIQRDLHEENRRSWNEATRAHNSHKADQAGFLRGGGSTLFSDEIELLGDISGKTLLHLQCNAGQDTLSLAGLGAKVTGVDISDEAIDFARKLSEDSGIPGTFERADVLDWLPEAAAAGRRFDIVFVSYGAIYWLSDIKAWAEGIAGVLAPGGRLVMIEFHPLGIFDDDWNIVYDYAFGGKHYRDEEGVNDYVSRSGEALAPGGYSEGETKFSNPHPAHAFDWNLGDVVTALIEAGLRIELVREYPYSNGDKIYPRMRELPGNRFASPDGMPELPFMFAVTASR
ncbi:MAG TPA: class I SAM-dependent methyltransferase [Thermoleophilaceae bacterium]